MVEKKKNHMVIMVGGDRSKVGKTRLVCDIVSQLKGSVLAVKCSVSDRINREDIIYDEDILEQVGKDTARYLKAGVAKAVLVKARRGHLGCLLKDIIPLSNQYNYMIIESNSAAKYINSDILIYIEDKHSDDRTRGSVYAKEKAHIIVEAFKYNINDLMNEIKKGKQP